MLARSVVMVDALANLDPSLGSNKEYGKGVLVGVVSAVMQLKSVDFREAVRIVCPNLPRNCGRKFFPDFWLDEFENICIELELNKFFVGD